MHGEDVGDAPDPHRRQVDVGHRVEEGCTGAGEQQRELGQRVERAAPAPAGKLARASGADAQDGHPSRSERSGHGTSVEADAGGRLVPQRRVEGHGELHRAGGP